MADDLINPSQRLLFLGITASPTDVVICLKSVATTESRTDVDTSSMCGVHSVPGLNTASMTVNGYIAEAPSTGKKSFKALHDWFAAGTPLFFLIARAVPATGEVEQSGECFIQTIGTGDSDSSASTFDMTLKVDGSIDVSLHV